MRAIFIGLFIIALIAGVSAKSFINSGQTSWFSKFLKSVGFAQKEEVQKKEIDDLMKNYSDQQEEFNGYLKEQQHNLQISKEQMSSLIENINRRDNNLYLLKIKDLMKRFADKNSLLIENGKQLMDYNEYLKNKRKAISDQNNLNAKLSNINKNQLLQEMKYKFSQQSERIKQQMQETMDLNDRMRQIQEEINQNNSDLSFKQNPEFVEKLQSISNTVQSLVENIKQKQVRIQEQNQRNLENINRIKEKIDNLKQKTFDNVDKNRYSDDMHALNDRIREQQQRLKDKQIR